MGDQTVIVTLLMAVYLICAVALSLYALATLVLLALYLRHRKTPPLPPPLVEFPKVVVQLPLYNERFVAARLIDAAAGFDYPKDRFIVQILDDSTDETARIAAAKAVEWAVKGIQVVHVRRENRTGFKAGALAYGLTLAQADFGAEFAAVFDADFVPPPDFLQKMLPTLMANPRLACVQARWGHLNPFENPLTLMQTLALDGHFVVEQIARSRGGLLMNFNGSGGVWRIAAIHEAGGWQDTTLTEDLDLSYRAQLKGWTFAYRPDVIVPAELPASIGAYKQQQARWARGGTQCLRRLLIPVWRTRGLSFGERLMATVHLCQYIVHPMMVLLALLTPILLVTRAIQQVPLGSLGILSLVPPILFVTSQAALYPNWARRSLALPVLLVLGMGLSRSNTRAVLSGLFGGRGTFNRTPKTAGTRAQVDSPRMSFDWVWEAVFSLYTLGATIIAVRLLPSLVPYMALYSLSYGVFAFFSARDAWLAYRAAWIQGRMVSPAKHTL
ncbi:MAG: glycosyltransferase [bacterium]|nr:glycosyltransferase [bacterium]